MSFTKKFLRRLAQGVAALGMLSAAQETSAIDNFLFGVRDENGMVNLIGPQSARLSGFSYHCGEHPIQGCPAVYDAAGNYLGVYHYTGQKAYICHFGPREESAYMHHPDKETPITFPCPDTMFYHVHYEACGNQHFIPVPQPAYQISWPKPVQLERETARINDYPVIVHSAFARAWESMVENPEVELDEGIYKFDLRSNGWCYCPSMTGILWSRMSGRFVPQTCDGVTPENPGCTSRAMNIWFSPLGETKLTLIRRYPNGDEDFRVTKGGRAILENKTPIDSSNSGCTKILIWKIGD